MTGFVEVDAVGFRNFHMFGSIEEFHPMQFGNLSIGFREPYGLLMCAVEFVTEGALRRMDLCR